jgi:hypothetical protein
MKEMLFDVSPEEPQKKRQSKRRPSQPETPSEPVFSVPRNSDQFVGYMGSVDGIQCADSSCGCEAHDITEVGMAVVSGDRKEPAWMVECFCCGTKQWISRQDSRFDEPEEDVVSAGGNDFVFDDGPFSGKTPAEVFAEYGRGVLEMLARDAYHPTWREPCQKHLDSTRLPE